MLYTPITSVKGKWLTPAPYGRQIYDNNNRKLQLVDFFSFRNKITLRIQDLVRDKDSIGQTNYHNSNNFFALFTIRISKLVSTAETVLRW